MTSILLYARYALGARLAARAMKVVEFSPFLNLHFVKNSVLPLFHDSYVTDRRLLLMADRPRCVLSLPFSHTIETNSSHIRIGREQRIGARRVNGGEAFVGANDISAVAHNLESTAKSAASGAQVRAAPGLVKTMWKGN